MASKTVTRPIKATFGEFIFIVYFNNLFILHQMSEGKTESESIVWGSNQLCQRFSFSFMMCSLVRVVLVHLIFIQYWKLKIKTSQSCFSMFDSSKIYNLNFQCLLLRKLKLNIILQYFENQKLKIENGQLVVLTFCFQFPLPKIQAIKNSNLTKQFMCNGVTAGWNPK